MDKRQMNVAWTTYVTAEEDKILKLYGRLLEEQGLIEKNKKSNEPSKYGILRFLITNVLAQMKMSFIPGEVKEDVLEQKNLEEQGLEANKSERSGADSNIERSEA